MTDNYKVNYVHDDLENRSYTTLQLWKVIWEDK